MEETKLLIAATTDKERVEVIIGTREKALSHHLNGADTEAVAAQLARERAKLTRPTFTGFPRREQITSEKALVCEALPNLPPDADDGVTIMLCHPGYGWIGFQLSESQAALLDENLRVRPRLA